MSLVPLKLLLLAVATSLFVLASVLCELAMVPGVYTLLSPQEEEIHFSSWGHRCTYSAAHPLKRVKFLSAVIYGKVYAELEKTQTRNSTVLIVLII